MPARANSRIDARSRELTKNLTQTRHQLENHFKSLKRRDAEFKMQKLMNIEEELKAKARMARTAQGPESNISRRQGPSPREQQVTATSTYYQPRAKSSERDGYTKTNTGLSRSASSPAWLDQFPAEWGGYGAMPKPPGSPAAFPLAVTRHCADTPACMHPPPHPGSQSMKPTPTRSMAAFTKSHTAALYAPPSPPPVVANTHASPGTPGARASLLAKCASDSVLSKGVADDVFLTEVGDNGENLIEKDPMIKRLGHYMALLGPRYKTIPKEMIWEKAEMGDMTPFQRRLKKAGGITAVGGGPDTSLRAGPMPGELTDSDGKARAAWLAARTAEQERRNRAARR